MKLLRSIFYFLWLYGCMLVLGAVFLIPTMIDGVRGAIAGYQVWAKCALWGLRWIVGAKVRFEGLENLPKGAGLFAAKHQSTLDILAPALFLNDAAFVYKAELHKAPIFGWYIQRARMIPIQREAAAAALKSMLRAARAARDEGRSIVIFPEGTRQKLDAPPDYKPGIVALYRDLGLPCTPIALNTGLVWKPKGIMRSPGVVTIKVLPAIPAGLSREDFMREVETRIETESQALLPPNLRRTASP